MIKGVVFFDLDHTLLNSNNKLESSSLYALRALKQNDILPVICSGRNISLIRSLMHYTKISNAICDNGCHLVYYGKSLYQESIPLSVLKSLVKITSARHNPLALQAKNTVAFTSKKRVPKASIRRYHNAPVRPNLYLNHEIIFISLFTQNHQDDKFYQKKFGKQLSIVRNCAVCLDVTNKGVNKGTGVEKMLKQLDLDNVPTYCFGNGLNDIPMFKVVNYPISMANGMECKHYAKYITTDCNHNGIYNGLKHFKLI